EQHRTGIRSVPRRAGRRRAAHRRRDRPRGARDGGRGRGLRPAVLAGTAARGRRTRIRRAAGHRGGAAGAHRPALAAVRVVRRRLRHRLLAAGADDPALGAGVVRRRGLGAGLLLRCAVHLAPPDPRPGRSRPQRLPRRRSRCRPDPRHRGGGRVDLPLGAGGVEPHGAAAGRRGTAAQRRCRRRGARSQAADRRGRDGGRAGTHLGTGPVAPPGRLPEAAAAPLDNGAAGIRKPRSAPSWVARRARSAVADRALGRFGPLAPLLGLFARLLGVAGPAGGFGFGGLLLEVGDLLPELRGPRHGLRVGAPPLFVDGLADTLLDGAQLALELVHPVARHLADGLPALLQLAQPGAGGIEILLGIEVGVGGQQLLLGGGVGLELRLALGDGGVARGEEDVLGALEPPPQRLVGLARRAAGGLPLAEQLAEDGGGAGPVGGVGEFLGPHAQLFLARLGGGALTVEFGEVRAAPAVERLARLGVALPQRVVDLAVDPADGLP